MTPIADSDWQRADPIELLLEGPGADRAAWARTLLLRMLEAHGNAHYRDHDRIEDRYFAQKALTHIAEAYAGLAAVNRPLLMRVMLVTPWTHIRSFTGLRVLVGDVVEAFSGVTGRVDLVEAVAHVVTGGADAVRSYPLDGVLLEERESGGVTFTIDRALARKIGTRPGSVRIDRVQAAVQGFHVHSFEANLRVLVPWWLDHVGADEGADVIKAQVDRMDRVKDRELSATRYGVMGVLDWAVRNPDHPAASDLLDRGIRDRFAPVRKAAARLAVALGHTDVLEGLMQRDRDRGVRKAAEKLIRDGLQ
jgi:hypothetical protein